MSPPSTRPPLLSPDWYRLAPIKPRLRSGVRVSRHHQRGETWFLLTDPVSGRHHRFNDLAYSLVGACDGVTTIDAIWAACVAAEGDDAPTQAEAIKVFAQAFAAQLFTGDVAPDVASIARNHSRTRAKQRQARLNPLAFRVPLWDPERFLQSHQHRWSALFTRPAGWAITTLMVLGLLLLLLNTDEVAQHASRELGSGRMLLLMWIVYPLMKALHEFAHAMAVKHYGGEVHEMGITLMMLTPVPYMDASASIAIPSKHQRMLVAGAGILVEASLACLALPLMFIAEPGIVKDIAFAIVFVGLLSTLVINGNPLMRFDGYHVLSDFAELPNLAPRSNRWWTTLLKRHLLSLHQLNFGTLSRGEQPWLWSYAPLALSYRLFLSAMLVKLASVWHPLLGLALMLLLAWQLCARPAWAAWRWLRRSPELRAHRPRAKLSAAALAVTLLLAAVLVPLPHRTHAPGLVWLPDDAQARAGSEGFVTQILVRDGEAVKAGTALLQLENVGLELELVQAEAELARLEVERSMNFGTHARRTAHAQEALARQQAVCARLRQRVQDLTLRASIDGRVALDPARLRKGQMVHQGEVVAQVLPEGPALVRAWVRNQDIAWVQQQPGAVQVQLPLAAEAQPARLMAHTPRATTQLPTRALGDAAGGSIAVDLTDQRGTTAREPHFQLDLKLADNRSAPIGARVLVTFAHGHASAAELSLRFIRVSFLRYFQA